MKSIRFLAELREKENLEIVEPSEEITEAYLEKSKKSLSASKLLYTSDFLEESVSMSYYSMYYATIALFFNCGIKCENHAAATIILKEVFELPELQNLLSFAKKERIDKQYYVEFNITKKDAEDLIKTAEEFKTEIQKFLINITYEKRKDFMITFDEITRMYP